jgi:hypothetical protein
MKLFFLEKAELPVWRQLLSSAGLSGFLDNKQIRGVLLYHSKVTNLPQKLRCSIFYVELQGSIG